MTYRLLILFLFVSQLIIAFSALNVIHAISNNEANPIIYWEYNNYDREIYFISWNPNENYLAFADGDLKILYFNGSMYWYLSLANRTIKTFSWNPDGELIAIATDSQIDYDMQESQIFIYNISNKSLVACTHVFYNVTISSLEWPLPNIIFIVFSNNTLSLFNVSSLKSEIIIINGSIIDASYSVVDNNIGVIYHTSSQYKLMIINTNGTILCDTIITGSYDVFDLHWLPNGHGVVISTYNEVLIYSLNGTIIWSNNQFTYPIVEVDVGYISSYLYTVERMQVYTFTYSITKVIDTKKGILWSSNYPRNYITSISVSKTEKYLSVATYTYYPDTTNKIITYRQRSKIIINVHGAETHVYLDCNYTGISPLTLIIWSGTHNLTLSNQYATLSITLYLKPMETIYYNLYTVYTMNNRFIMINFSDILINNYFIVNATNMLDVETIEIDNNIFCNPTTSNHLLILLEKGTHNITFYHHLDYKPYNIIINGNTGDIITVEPIFNEPSLKIYIHGYTGRAKLIINDTVMDLTESRLKLYLPIGVYNITLIPYDTRYIPSTKIIHLTSPLIMNISIHMKPRIVLFVGDPYNFSIRLNVSINNITIQEIDTNTFYEIYINCTGETFIVIHGDHVYSYKKLMYLNPDTTYNIELKLYTFIEPYYKFIILPINNTLQYVSSRELFMATVDLDPNIAGITLLVNNTNISPTETIIVSTSVINITILYNDYIPLIKQVYLESNKSNIVPIKLYFLYIISNNTISMSINEKVKPGSLKIILENGSYTVLFKCKDCIAYAYEIETYTFNDPFINLEVYLRELPTINAGCILAPIHDYINYIYTRNLSIIIFNVSDTDIIIGNTIIKSNLYYIVEPGKYSVYFSKYNAQPYIINITVSPGEFLLFSLNFEAMRDIKNNYYTVPIDYLDKWLSEMNFGLLEFKLSRQCTINIDMYKITEPDVYLIEPGTYSLKIICGSKIFSDNIVIEVGRKTTIGNATLAIQSDHDGYVFIDGKLYGYLTNNNPLIVCLSPGEYSVYIVIPNSMIKYNSTIVYNVSLGINDYMNIEIKTSKLMLYEAFGDLYINDAYIGKVNGNIEIILVPGRYTISIIPETIFYDPYIKSLTLKGGEESYLYVSFPYSMFTYGLISTLSIIIIINIVYFKLLRPRLSFELDRDTVIEGLVDGITVKVVNRGLLPAKKRITVYIGKKKVYDQKVEIKGKSCIGIKIPLEEETFIKE